MKKPVGKQGAVAKKRAVVSKKGERRGLRVKKGSPGNPVGSKKAHPKAKPGRPAAGERKEWPQISIKVPPEWVAVADSIARSSPLGAARAAVFRLAVGKGLEAMSGKPLPTGST